MAELWKKITEHPLTATTAAIFLFIAAIWPVFVSHETIPDYLNQKGWAVTMPPWYYIFALTLGCVVAGLQVALIRVVLARRQRELRSLEALAQDHSKTMQNRVQIVHEKLSVTLNLNDTPQYVIFHITIFNRSIYPLTLEEKVEQRFTFEGTRLEEARIYQEPNINMQKSMIAKPVNYFSFSIKQYIPSSAASHIQSPEASTFGAHNVAVRFTYRDYTGAPKQVRVPLARQIPAPLFSTFNFACQLPIIYPD